MHGCECENKERGLCTVCRWVEQGTRMCNMSDGQAVNGKGGVGAVLGALLKVGTVFTFFLLLYGTYLW